MLTAMQSSIRERTGLYIFPVSVSAKTQRARKRRGDEANATKNNRASVRQAIDAVDSMEIRFSVSRPAVSSHLLFGLNGTELPKNMSNFFLIIF